MTTVAERQDLTAMPRAMIDLTGQRFTRLVVLERAENDALGSAQWVCRCDCGAIKIIRSGTLRRGATKSCGCLKQAKAPLQERITRKSTPDESTGCWNWTGATTARGYGKSAVRIGGKSQSVDAHRLAWVAFAGEIPAGMHVLHTCDNRRCVNPQHLFLGTHQDNVDDMMAKGRHASGKVTK